MQLQEIETVCRNNPTDRDQQNADQIPDEEIDWPVPVQIGSFLRYRREIERPTSLRSTSPSRPGEKKEG